MESLRLTLYDPPVDVAASIFVAGVVTMRRLVVATAVVVDAAVAEVTGFRVAELVGRTYFCSSGTTSAALQMLLDSSPMVCWARSEAYSGFCLIASSTDSYGLGITVTSVGEVGACVVTVVAGVC